MTPLPDGNKSDRARWRRKRICGQAARWAISAMRRPAPYLFFVGAKEKTGKKGNVFDRRRWRMKGENVGAAVKTASGEGRDRRFWAPQEVRFLDRPAEGK